MGRIIERTEYASYVQRNKERVNDNPDYYRQRQQIIEHQFGTLKRNRNFDHVLTRGKEKVLAEVYIAFTVYNLGRSLSILGFPELIRRMKAFFKLFFRNLGSTAIMKYLSQAKSYNISITHTVSDYQLSVY